MPGTAAFPAAFGFAFVAAWAGFSFLTAIACLIGALVFALVTLALRGQLHLSDLRERADAARSGFLSPDRPR